MIVVYVDCDHFVLGPVWNLDEKSFKSFLPTCASFIVMYILLPSQI